MIYEFIYITKINLFISYNRSILAVHLTSQLKTKAGSISTCGNMKTQSRDFKGSGSFPDNTALHKLITTK